MCTVSIAIGVTIGSKALADARTTFKIGMINEYTRVNDVGINTL